MEVQKSLAYEAERLHDIFDPMGGYTFDLQEEKVKFGRVDAASGIRMRSKAGTSGDVLATVPDAALVLLLEKGNAWSKIQHGADVGYVKNEYMHYYSARNSVLTYTSLDGFASYRIGHTLAEYQAGQLSQAELIDLNNPDEEATATVNTGRDDLALNLRSTPGTDGAVLAALPNGEAVRPLLEAGEWTLVDYNGLRGYLMAQYLERDDGEDDTAAVRLDEGLLQAIVKPRYDDRAQVYDADSDDTVILGSLKAGLFVNVIESTESGWSHINYQGHEGYMRDEDMVFLNGV